ncbi:hypothetical protein BH11PLA2_BH11PLA2_39960 [soil metagenome]
MDNHPAVSLIVCYILVFYLYVIKYAFLRHRRNLMTVAVFGTGIAICIPVLWLLSPDWNNPGVLLIGNYVGIPIAILTVPVLSFVVDLLRGSNFQTEEYRWRVPVEFLIVIPGWFMFWIVFEFQVLGWSGNDL